MPLVSTVLGWQAFGLAARALQLGINGQSIRSAPQWYLVSLPFWGAFGYGWFEYRKSVMAAMEELREKDPNWQKYSMTAMVEKATGR